MICWLTYVSATSILIAIFIDESNYNNGTLEWNNMSGLISEIPGGSKMTEVGMNIGKELGEKLDEIGDILFKNR